MLSLLRVYIKLISFGIAQSALEGRFGGTQSLQDSIMVAWCRGKAAAPWRPEQSRGSLAFPNPTEQVSERKHHSIDHHRSKQQCQVQQ
jgi:hypothetical protein